MRYLSDRPSQKEKDTYDITRIDNRQKNRNNGLTQNNSPKKEGAVEELTNKDDKKYASQAKRRTNLAKPIKF